MILETKFIDITCGVKGTQCFQGNKEKWGRIFMSGGISRAKTYLLDPGPRTDRMWWAWVKEKNVVLDLALPWQATGVATADYTGPDKDVYLSLVKEQN